MNIYIGDCPYCKSRLLVEINEYYTIEVDDSILILSYIAECWKCGKVSKSELASNIEEQIMSQEGLEHISDIHSCVPISLTKKLEYE